MSTVQASVHDSLRDMRYCELVFLQGGEVAVYDTLLLNECPDDLWKNISIQDIKNEAKASFVYLNGPRRLMVDDIQHHHAHNQTLRQFHNLQMKKVGVLRPSVRDFVFGAAPFKEHHLRRNTTWVYASGKRIHELIDPQGHVYVMQSYAVSSSQQSENDLAHLKHRIQLPKQWQYKTGILQQDMSVSVMDHESIVIQDNLQNTYQRSMNDWLM